MHIHAESVRPLAVTLIIPPVVPKVPPTPWVLTKTGYNSARLVIDATLTRAEVYKLIGQLERLGLSL